MIDETPRQAAERIVRWDLDDPPTEESLIDAIATAIQAASNAQLDRDRAVIDAAEKACQVYHDAWKIADDERMLLRKSVELLRCAMKERTEDSQPHE